jgi:hypothetical protein
MRIEARKLGVIEKFWLRIQFPRIPKENDIFVKIPKANLKLMKALISREESFITQIHKQNKEIEDLKYQLKEKEQKRRKTAGKVGGMQKYINKLRDGKNE